MGAESAVWYFLVGMYVGRNVRRVFVRGSMPHYRLRRRKY